MSHTAAFGWVNIQCKTRVKFPRKSTTVRPHQSLNYLPPVEFKQHHHSLPTPQQRATSQE